MTVALVVPLATDCPHRLRAWNWIEARYRATFPDWEIVTGTAEGAWCKAQAIADALGKTDADTLVVADADCYVNQIGEYVTRVAAGDLEWAVPHRRVIRLTAEATERVFVDGLPTTNPPPRELDQAQYTAMIGGGIVTLTRSLYERVPLDARFLGWGGEDESWGRGLRALGGRHEHGPHPLWHLWHPAQPRMNRRMGNRANRELTERYMNAAGNRAAIAALIEEGRCHSRTSLSAP